MFYQELEAQTKREQTYLLSAPVITDVLSGQFDLYTYLAFLNQAYHHVKHTVPLLMAAGSRLSEAQFYLQHAIVEYIEEEAGHEHWILDDMATCGADRSAVSTASAPYESDVMVSYLFDTVMRRNPVGIFGMVLVLEGTSAGLATEVAALVQSGLSLPDEAMSYLKSHGTLDQEHLRGFKILMDTIRDREDQLAILNTASAVYRLYGDVYRAIPDQAEAMRRSRAA